eukprot:c27378_g1_i1 orf=472-2232(+)
MKRSRSVMEGQDSMVASSAASRLLLPLQQSCGDRPSVSTTVAQLSLSFASSEASPSPHRVRGNVASEQVRDTPSESASSGDTWSTERAAEPSEKLRQERDNNGESVKSDSDNPLQAVVRYVAKPDRLTLKVIASGPIEVIAERLPKEPEELLEELKAQLRDILGGTGGIQQREEFALLQKLVLDRSDLSPELLMRASRIQLEVLVAIKTGIQAFLHPDISITENALIEVFFYKKCRNMACQNQLPGDGCTCSVCTTTKNGFCNACMCTICSKFDFEVNTCRWIGCDFCSHWTHTDCAIRVGQISMGPSLKGPAGSAEMLFRCKACKQTSELIGWVKNVFRTCAAGWGREELMKEFDSVRRIFHGSDDSKGKRLFWKSEELLERLESGADNSNICKEVQRFFQDLEDEDDERLEGKEVKMIGSQEACNQIAALVQEAVGKMEGAAEEKAHALKKTQVALEVCDKELKEKKREVAEVLIERQQKKLQIEELEAIVRLKQAEAEIFQMRADDARREVERLQHIVVTNSEKAEEYTSRYLKLRLDEAEAEQHYHFEKIQLQQHSRLQPDPSQMLLMYKIQDLLRQVQTKN